MLQDSTFKRVLGKSKRGWLRPIVISLLRKSPKNGEEMIDEIERMSFGWWRPSPGSLYPLLGELVKEGITKKNKDGKYELTETGRKVVYPWEERFYAGDRDLKDAIDEINGYVSYFEDIKTESGEKIKEHEKQLKEIAKRIEKLLK
ncbi:MAG: PadR family transcriptional regulator [Candidatus Micrarchaeia archaeon]